MLSRHITERGKRRAGLPLLLSTSMRFSPTLGSLSQVILHKHVGTLQQEIAPRTDERLQVVLLMSFYHQICPRAFIWHKTPSCLAENEAASRLASPVLTPFYVAKLTHFLSFWCVQLTIIVGPTRGQKCSLGRLAKIWDNVMRVFLSDFKRVETHSPPSYLQKSAKY